MGGLKASFVDDVAAVKENRPPCIVAAEIARGHEGAGAAAAIEVGALPVVSDLAAPFELPTQRIITEATGCEC